MAAEFAVKIVQLLFALRLELDRDRFQITDSSTNGSYIVPANAPSLFIRRETSTLERSGFIGFGWKPGPDDKDRVFYSVVAAP